MIRPAFLKSGSKAGIISPAGIVTESEVEPGIEIIENWGLQVERGQHLYSKCNFFAGTDNERLSDFQKMLDDPEIRAIFCSRGGYGIIRLIDKLDFTGFLKSPKWIVGYSDITIMHIFLNKHLNCMSIHGIMTKNFANSRDDGSVISLKNALFGQALNYSINNHQFNIPGDTSGKLTGGNLSIIYSLQGTRHEIDTEGNILFIEDVNEVIYHIDRMMMNLQSSGKLASLKGLIVGGMTKITDTEPGYGKTAYDVISEMVSGYGFPVIFGFQAGHLYPNLSLIMGEHVRLKVTDLIANIDFR